MHNTGFEHADTKIQHMAGGYYLQNGTYLPRQSTDISDAYAAGALYSTTEDLFKWNEALNSEKLVSKNTLEQAFTGATLNNGDTSAYGFGWMLNQWRGVKEVSHGGDITGFNSYISRFPELQFAVIVLSNFEMNPPGPIPNARQLAQEITNICLSETMQTTPTKKSIQVKPEILRTYEGKYRLKDAPPEIVNVMGDSLTILVKENKIFIGGKLGEVELMPKDANKFFLQDKTTIEFLSENNTIKGFKMDLMGMAVRILMTEKYR